MELVFAVLARAEMAEARRYYERQQRGLGREFVREASASAQRILEQPLAWRNRAGAPIPVQPIPVQNVARDSRRAHRRVGRRTPTSRP